MLGYRASLLDVEQSCWLERTQKYETGLWHSDQVSSFARQQVLDMTEVCYIELQDVGLVFNVVFEGQGGVKGDTQIFVHLYVFYHITINTAIRELTLDSLV